MGVLACDRRGCENIMSDYFSHRYGYLCRECYSELLEECDRISIGDFMCQEKDCDPVDSARLQVENEFTSRY